MKPISATITLKLILILSVIILVMVASLCFVSFKYGHTKAEAEYTAEVVKITNKALADQDALNSKLNEMNHENSTSIFNERQRIQELQRQLRSRKDAIECTQDSGGNNVAIIPVESVRLLVESTNYKSLPKADNRSCPFSPTETVTANLLVGYTNCIIGEYNTEAGLRVGLINSTNLYLDELKKKAR